MELDKVNGIQIMNMWTIKLKYTINMLKYFQGKSVFEADFFILSTLQNKINIKYNQK